MERSYFRVVKEAFGASQSSLNTLGVHAVPGRSKEWQAARCPCCSDTDGSASISMNTGYLKCRQCGREMDLFEWWQDLHGLPSSWEAAKQVGDLLSVPLPKLGKGKQRAPQKMTPELLDSAIHNLMEAEEAEGARQHFRGRGLWDPVRLSRFGVGFLAGAIVFAQFYPNGELRTRYRIYTPNGRQKWRWSKGGGAPNGFWPHLELPAGAEILLCEGEMDVLAAYKLGRLHRRKTPIFAYTWTGGATAPVSSRLMPDTWPRRTVRICYDNDTFQGPDRKTHRAPDEKKLKDMLRRRTNLVDHVARVFAANHCKVHLLAIPIDPVDRFGADLRDWLTEEGTFEDLPSYPYEELVDPADDPQEISFDEIRAYVGEFVTVAGSVQSVRDLQALIPKTIGIECPMNCKSICNSCGVPTRFADQVIDCSLYRGELLEAFITDDAKGWLKRHLLGKPTGCSECTLRYEETWPGSSWSISPEEDGTKRAPIVSTETPSIAGEIAVTGYVHAAGNTVGLFATKIEQLDKPHFDLDEFHNSLLPITPWKANDCERIWIHIDTVVADLANNVTEIYGREELHILAILVAHSVLRYKISGHSYRGWLDACGFGETRQGKSETIRRLFEFWRLGQAFTCMDNFSRAGLTVGGGKSGEQMVPGIFPKNHGKLLFFDEFHHMAQASGENPMICLQSARDDGKVSAAKIYGNTKLQASVRLITAGNWFERKRRSLQYPCQHLLHFYGVPEAVGRLDFAWCITEPADMNRETVEHVWQPELARALILRAWAMEPHMVHIEPEAWKRAEKIAQEWDQIYVADVLPLHTGAEKAHSVIRIAIAIANLCYSHPEGKPRECLTRVGHVEAAIQWMLRCWENLQYDLFSQRIIRSRSVSQPYTVEALLTVHLQLHDSDSAVILLSQLCETQDHRQLSARVMGSGGAVEEMKDFNKWLGQMNRLSAIESSGLSSYQITYTPTPGCIRIMQRLIRLASDDPEGYVERYRALERWFNSPESRMGPNARDPHGLNPLDGDDSDESEFIF
jgi:hypothetical protein